MPDEMVADGFKDLQQCISLVKNGSKPIQKYYYLLRIYSDEDNKYAVHESHNKAKEHAKKLKAEDFQIWKIKVGKPKFLG